VKDLHFYKYDSVRKMPLSKSQLVQYNYPLLILEGVVIGIVTGNLGASGGFLLIFALVLFTRLYEKAVGTYLLSIADNSLIGFLGDLGSGHPIHFSL
jgi:uncharacterized membrane protein YfcA